jgi:YbbR domain-containing protein
MERKLNIGIGIIIGCALMFAIIYFVNLNKRVTAIETFLNNAIQQSQIQAQQQMRKDIKKP